MVRRFFAIGFLGGMVVGTILAFLNPQSLWSILTNPTSPQLSQFGSVSRGSFLNILPLFTILGGILGGALGFFLGKIFKSTSKK